MCTHPLRYAREADINSCLRTMCRFLLISFSRIRKVYRKLGGLDKLPAALFRAESLVVCRSKRSSNTLSGERFPTTDFLSGTTDSLLVFLWTIRATALLRRRLHSRVHELARSLSARTCELLGLSFRRSTQGWPPSLCLCCEGPGLERLKRRRIGADAQTSSP